MVARYARCPAIPKHIVDDACKCCRAAHTHTHRPRVEKRAFINGLARELRVYGHV